MLHRSLFQKPITWSRGLSVCANTAQGAGLQRENFYGVSKDVLINKLKQWNQPIFRADQLRSWIYDKGVTSFELMQDLPKSLRTQLAEAYSIGTLSVKSELVSQKDGTIKRAYELPDKQIIESVLMPYEDGRYTACISSQAGCAMG